MEAELTVKYYYNKNRYEIFEKPVVVSDISTKEEVVEQVDVEEYWTVLVPPEFVETSVIEKLSVLNRDNPTLPNTIDNCPLYRFSIF